MANPHGELFKAIFSDPVEAGAELRAVLPSALVDRIDWSTLRRLPAELPDPVDAEQRADLLFVVDCGGRDLLLHLLLEHKSREERWVALQMLGYAVRIWQRHRREHPRSRRLPPVISVVVHHGPRPWRGGTDLADLFDIDAPLREGFRDWLPGYRFVLDDLTELGPDELRSRVVSNAARLALACLQRVRRGGDAEQLLRELRGMFRAVLDEPSPSRQLVLVLSYLSKVWDLEFAGLRSLVRRELGPELEKSMTSTYDRIAAEVRAETIREMRAEIIREARAEIIREARDEIVREARVETLRESRVQIHLEILATRFGELPAEVEDRVRAANEAQLRAWIPRIATAATLDEVLAEPD